MSFYQKDIIQVSIPRILGSPPVTLSFQLFSESIDVTLSSERVYNARNAEVIQNDINTVTLRCYNETVILLHSEFIKVQDIYWYPFISSKFEIDLLEISGSVHPRIEISVPNNYKSISKLSLINNNDKHFEKWTSDTGTYYFPLRNGNNSLSMTFKSDGARIYDGLIPTLLPLLVIILNFLLKRGSLPKAVNSNQTNITIAALLVFTPIFLSNFRQFLRNSFMSLTLGLFLYIHAYVIAIIYIIIMALFPAYTYVVIVYFLLWVFILLLNIQLYFRRGTFYKVFRVVLFDPIWKLMRLPYLIAWKIKKPIK